MPITPRPSLVCTYHHRGVPELAAWANRLTCRTAALASYAALTRRAWWRPLLAGGPVLDVRQVGAGLAFTHHRVPGPAALGLSLRTATRWDEAWAGIGDELRRRGIVIIAGDEYRLPWREARGQRHSPLWFPLAVRDGEYIVDDVYGPGETGTRGAPVSVRIPEADLWRVCRAVPAGPPAHALAEGAALGIGDAPLGPRYRWLSAESAQDGVAASCLAGSPPSSARSLALLAEYYRRHAADPRALGHAEELRYGHRMRELMAAALVAERTAPDGRVEVPDPGPWQAAALAWRRLPPLLMHARQIAETGRRSRLLGTLTGTLSRLAELEDSLSGQLFPFAEPELAGVAR